MKGRDNNFDGLVFLIVEDVPKHRWMLTHDIVRRGGSVLIADSYRAWQDILRRGHLFDLVIVDLVLDEPCQWPQKSGIAVLDDIRSQKIPARAVIWSWHADDPEYGIEASERGITDLITKNESLLDDGFLELWKRAENYWERDLVLANGEAKRLARAAQYGRYVCDEHNAQSVITEECRARRQIEIIVLELKARLESLRPSDAAEARKLLLVLERLTQQADVAGSISWSLMRDQLRKFVERASLAAIVELLKYIFENF